MKFLLSILIMISSFSQLYAWDKDNTIEQIKKAQRAIITIDNNLDIRPYIPFDIYSDALVDLLMSRSEIKAENYVSAYYHASQSLIKLETIELLAQAKQYRQKLLIIEKNYYKKNQTNPGYVSIVKASLHFKGDVFQTDLPDKQLFTGKAFMISNKGKAQLNRIIEVLQNFPNSNIQIIGHTRYKDYKQKSRLKARAVYLYLKNNGIADNRIKFLGAGNTEVMNTVLGFKRIDRIEIIISGIETN